MSGNGNDEASSRLMALPAPNFDDRAGVSNPFVGPRTFTRQEGDRFFGREQEALDLLAVVISQRLVLFYAPSGAGKSSLLNARLVPNLENRGFIVLPIGRVGGELPAGIGSINNIFCFNLMASLEQGKGGQGGDPQRLAWLTLAEFLARLTSDDGQSWYYDDATEASPTSPSTAAFDTGPNYVLIVDQFEEILSTHPDRWEERAAFFAQLDAAMRIDPNLWVLLTLREDYVAALDPYRRLMADKLRARFYMRRMGTVAAREAIMGPAAWAGRSFAPDVAQRLVENLAAVRVQGDERYAPGEFVEPVQLQAVCYQLWETLQPALGTEITLADLERLMQDGELASFVDQALTNFYEQALDDAVNTPGVDIGEQEVRNWFSMQMITEAGTRGLVYRGEQTTGGLPNAVVKRLEDNFIIHSETRTGGIWYELVHDRFISPILKANAARRSPLYQDAQAWLDSGKDAERLYSGAKLKEAISELYSHPERLSPFEREFVQAGQAALVLQEQALEQTRQRELQLERQRAAEQTAAARRLRWLVIALVLALLVAVALSIYARRQTNVAQTQAMIALHQKATSEALLIEQATVSWQYSQVAAAHELPAPLSDSTTQQIAGNETPSATPAQAPIVRTTRRTNVWSGPGRSYEVIAVMPANAEVKITGKSPEEGWWQIALPYGESGWVYGPQVEIIGATEGVAMVTDSLSPSPTPTTVCEPTPQPSVPSLPGAGLKAKLWEPGRTLRVKFLDGDPALQTKVMQAAQQWTQYANLTFDFADHDQADIRISFEQEGSWAYLGTDALNVPQSQPTMNFGALPVDSSDEAVNAVTLHLFGHALALINEEQQPNANIPWDVDALYSFYGDRETVERNFLTKYDPSEMAVPKPFDMQSIMLSPISNSFTCGDYEVGTNNVLSQLDKESISQLYPR